MFRPCLVCNTVSGTVKGNYSNTRSCLSTTDGPLHCTAPTPAGGAEAPAQRGAGSPSLQSISVHTTPPVQFLPSHMETILKPNPHAEQNFFPETPLPGPRSQPPEHPIRSYPTGKKAVPSKRLCRQGSYMSAYQPLLQQHGQIWNRNFRSISLCKLRHGLWGVTNPAAENT
jgi:hypothetical protein